MKKLFLACSLLMVLTVCQAQSQRDESVDLPRAETPEKVTTAMDAFFSAAAKAKLDVHSVMIVKDGAVIYSHWQSKGAPNVPHVLHSVSKTFTATAVGLAIAEGRLNLTDKVVSFFPDKLPNEVSDNLMAMTIRDLLTMTCGHDDEPNQSKREEWVKTFLAHPVKHTPGTFYLYNSLGTYMLSAIVQKITGQKVVDFLTLRLFEPLHIDKPRWDESPQGINCGGWGLFIKTEDMLKFGQLFLQQGQWEGKQLLSREWVAEASACQVPSVPAGTRPDEVESKGLTTDNCAWLLGYGYQMWRCPDNAYRADGARGQYIIVMPDQDAVIAVTADSPDLQAELSSIYKYLFPVLKK